jgi:hypothetical protein
MTPMLRELHDEHIERLKRMKAWHDRNLLVPIGRIHRPRRVEKPRRAPPLPKPKRSITPIEEIPSPEIGAGVKVYQIQRVVAQRYNVSVDEMKSNSHYAFVVLPRQIAYTLARRLTPRSLPAIGHAFGNRDHTTIFYGIQKIEERASEDAAFAAELKQLENVIMGRGRT